MPPTGGRGRRIEVQGHPWLPSEFEVSLGSIRLCLNNSNNKKTHDERHRNAQEKGEFRGLSADFGSDGAISMAPGQEWYAKFVKNSTFKNQ